MDNHVALVDFDDSLFFTAKPIEYATREILGRPYSREAVRGMNRGVKHKIYRLAQTKYEKHSKPNGFLIRKLRTDGKRIIIVMTARPASQRKHTKSLLEKYKVPFDFLLMRSKLELLLEDEEWKLRMIKNFLKKYKMVSYYDDKLDNVAYIRKGVGQSKRLRVFQVFPKKLKEIS